MNASLGLGWTSEKAPAASPWLLLPVLVTGVLFYLDLHAPTRMMFGLPYLLAVVFAQMVAGGLGATVSAGVAALLVVAGPLLAGDATGGDPAWLVALGRLSVIGAIGLMVLFLRQRDEARATLAEQTGALENTSSQRSDQLRLVNAQLHREIAERRRAEVRSSYLASIVESSADAIIGQSLDGTIVSWNSGASRVYGHDRESVLGQPSSCLVPAEVEEELLAILARVARGEKVEEVESVRLRSDGTMFDVSATFSPILDERGAILGASVIERDITRRMHAESALQSLNAELEAKVIRRTEDLKDALNELESFSYTVSHDLRAPLRALRGLAETLVEEAGSRLEAPDRDLLDRMQAAASRMERMVEDLLMLSRSNELHVEKEVVNLGDAARVVVEELKASAPGRDVQWEIGEGLLAWGDPGLLRVVVQNLLGNAFKYTDVRGKAVISFAVEERSGQSVTYCVRDNGAGFDPSEAEQIFRPFSRLSRTAHVEGSGIGLATVERIVERHGGRVWAEARKGEGATFRFRLPVPEKVRSFDDDDFEDFEETPAVEAMRA